MVELVLTENADLNTNGRSPKQNCLGFFQKLTYCKSYIPRRNSENVSNVCSNTNLLKWYPILLKEA